MRREKIADLGILLVFFVTGSLRTTVEACADVYPTHCPGWSNLCSSHTWVANICKLTCNLCGSGSSSGWSTCTKTCGTGTQYSETCSGGTCTREYRACSKSACTPAYCAASHLRTKVGIPHACCNINANDPECGATNQNNDPRVFGGISAKSVAAWPWAVALLKWLTQTQYSTTNLCGATLISSNHILTAAHCIQADMSSWRAHIGILRLSDALHSAGYEIASTHKHPSYNFPRNDIAVIRLGSLVPTTSTTKPACLPGGEITPQDTTCYVIGWGKSHHSTGQTNHLQEGKIMNYDVKFCQHSYKTIPSLAYLLPFLNGGTGYLCAGNIVDDIDSCAGDSGSAMICQRCSSCSWYVAGVVSLGHPTCSAHGYPAVYTKVRDFESWIVGITVLSVRPAYCSQSVGP